MEKEKTRYEWLDKWKEHDLEISPFAPSYCRKCNLSGMDLNHYKCTYSLWKRITL